MLRVVERPQFGPTPAQVALRMFLRSYSMSLLQALGVTLIALGSLLAGGTAFLISWNWIGAARDGVDHRHRLARFAYGLGGCCGTLTVILLAPTVKRLLAHF